MNEVSINHEVITAKEVSIFKQKKFLFLWIASIFSSLSVSFFLFSESWYVVKVLDLEASLGLVFIAASVPRLLFMAIGGVIADRMSRSIIMFMSDITRAILLVGLIVMLVLDAVNLWTFISFAFIFGILDAFFWPASSSILPTIIPKDQLTRANSIVQVTNQFAMIAGPMLAGFIIHWKGYPYVFGVTASLLFLASILVYLIKASPSEVNEQEKELSMLQSIFEGVKYVRTSAFLSALLLTSLFLNLLIVGPIQMGLPLFAKNILNGDTLDFSFMEGAVALGMLVGAIIVGVLNIKKRRGKFAMITIGIMALSFLLLSQTTVLWQSLAALFCIGLFISASNIPLISVIQTIVEEKMIGRVMSLLSMCSMGLIPVSYAITSVLITNGLAINTIMMLGAIPLLVLVPLIYWRVPAIRLVD